MRITLEDILIAAKFIRSVTNSPLEQALWARNLLNMGMLLRLRWRPARKVDQQFGGGSLGDLFTAMRTTECQERFSSSDPEDLKALSVVAGFLAERIKKMESSRSVSDV